MKPDEDIDKTFVAYLEDGSELPDFIIFDADALLFEVRST